MARNNIPNNIRVIGFFPDGYIPELNLFIEFDERHHFIDDWCTYTEKDITRELTLASFGCMIFRIKENEWLNDPQEIIDSFSIFGKV